MAGIVGFLKKNKNKTILKPLFFLKRRYDFIRVYLKYNYRRITLGKQQDINGIEVQGKHWEKALINTKQSDVKEEFGWGDFGKFPETQQQYISIKNFLISIIDKNSSVVEIGSYDGFWTQFLLGADKVICVDVFQESYNKIRQRYNSDKISFYLSKGDELSGIGNQSVNLVFAIDCLVRLRKEAIEKYFEEFYRVLVPKGRIYIHLPINNKMCMQLGFECLSTKDIKILCAKYFSEFKIDNKALPHGAMISAIK